MTPRPVGLLLSQARYPKIGSDILHRKHMASEIGGDPIKIDPSVATFAWNASRMSEHADLAPINIVLTITACFCVHDDVTESAVTQLIQNH